MNEKELLIQEIKQIPDEQIDEVIKFVRALKSKREERRDILVTSESSLAKDWLREEEDVAWQNL